MLVMESDGLTYDLRRQDGVATWCRLLACAASVWIWSGSTAVLGQRDLRDIPDPDPELERASFELPKGFQANLYAADPLLAKPIQMNFDHLGQLWIATSSVYPQIKP